MSPLRWSFLGRVPYGAAREIQERLASQRAAGAAADALMLLEHEPVVTAGRSSGAPLGTAADVAPGAPPRVVAGRGGRETYHGPGQLVAYPVVALRAGGRAVRGFVSALEGAMCDVARAVGVEAWSREGLPGIWAGDAGQPAKLGFVGLAVRRAVTLHGCALNVERHAEEGFVGFAPCGLADVRVTSLEALAQGGVPTVETAARIFALALAERLSLRAVEDELLGSADAPRRAAAAPLQENDGRKFSARAIRAR